MCAIIQKMKEFTPVGSVWFPGLGKGFILNCEIEDLPRPGQIVKVGNRLYGCSFVIKSYGDDKRHVLYVKD